MKLISSKETLEFLGQAAPYPWIKRMLLWMIFYDELTPYFLEGRIESWVTMANYIYQIDPMPDFKPSSARDAILKEHYAKEISDKLVGKDSMEQILESVDEWSKDDEPHTVGCGFFIYADEIDWENGILTSEGIPGSNYREEHFFPDADEHLLSEFDNGQFHVSFSGMNFRMNEIELLLPTAKLQLSFSNPSVVATAKNKNIGRPRKWDWDGAMAHLVSIAQHPDGLPTGAGAQARIEEVISAWFISQTGDSPATSQIRQRAQIVIEMVEKD